MMEVTQMDEHAVLFKCRFIASLRKARPLFQQSFRHPMGRDTETEREDRTACRARQWNAGAPT